MDRLILGLLMLQSFTMYEFRNVISTRLWGICSDSAGGIQAAIKKLLTAEMITFDEYVEKSVNKKRYSITDKGRGEFLSWVQTSADITGTTRMELSKLFFMGLVPMENRPTLIGELIANAEKELGRHLELQSAINSSIADAKEKFITFWKNNSTYQDGIHNAVKNTNDSENITDISDFQMATVQFIIDSRKFEIEWFKKFKERNM